MALFLISLSFLIASRRNGVDIDLFHEMCLARQFAEEGTFPQTDAFAYTPTVEQVVHHEWGTGAIAYGVVEQLGLKSNGLMALKYLLVALIVGTCCLAARLRGATWPMIVPCFALATILGGQIGFTTIRAQVFHDAVSGDPVLPSRNRSARKEMVDRPVADPSCCLGERSRRHCCRPWHLLLYVLFRFVEPYLQPESTHEEKKWSPKVYLAVVAVVSFALLLVNPYGISYPFYLYYGTTLDRPLINEWQPLLTAVTDTGFLTLLGVSILIAGISFKNTWRQRPFEVFVVLLTAYLAFKHVRHLSIYAVTWTCVVPSNLMQSSIGKELTKVGYRLAKPLTIFAIAGGVYCLALATQDKFWRCRYRVLRRRRTQRNALPQSER